MCDKMVLEISQGTLEMFGEAGMLSGHEANEANEGSCLARLVCSLGMKQMKQMKGVVC